MKCMEQMVSIINQSIGFDIRDTVDLNDKTLMNLFCSFLLIHIELTCLCDVNLILFEIFLPLNLVVILFSIILYFIL